MKLKKLLLFTLSASLLLSGCSLSASKEDRTYTDTLFDTVISVQILEPVKGGVVDGCKKLCQDYDVKFSTTNKESEIYKINHAKGKPVEVSDDTITLIQKGQYYGKLSKGALDITIGSVSSLWDFHKEAPKKPSKYKILKAVKHVNYKNIDIQGNTVRLTDSKAKLDVGAIAKGYIADRLKEYLVDQGVHHAVINLGGNVLTLGGKADGSPYNIGIQKPFDKSGQPITSVKVSDQSVVTTGNYQRYFEMDGELYHHVLDSSTGYPCNNDLSSVTIITDSSLTADALSTTCFLLGYEKGMKMVNLLDNVDAVFITKDNELHYSKNFKY